jgi:hypothetical protein
MEDDAAPCTTIFSCRGYHISHKSRHFAQLSHWKPTFLYMPHKVFRWRLNYLKRGTGGRAAGICELMTGTGMIDQGL